MQGSMNCPAFLTKVRLPQRRPDVLRRPRLVDFLHQQVDKRLVLLSAAAGYGKTTLLVDFAHEVDLPVCWYSLDASDADPRTFFEYIILSLRQRFPTFGSQTESLLGSLSDVGREVSSIIASLTNEIQTDIPDYFLLILDDFHWADGSETVSSALDLLIYHLPDNCHLLVSSRTLPRLTFSRLAAQRQVVGLGTTDLRFTTDELSRLLREHYRLVIPSDQASELVEAAEGWITGILLTTHTMWMGLVENLVKAKGAGSPIFDYLANEAYLLLPPDVQDFLLRSSVLPQMSAQRCDRLFANGKAEEMLRYLVRANLFVTQIEGPEEWYRYHNLFQEFLQAKLRAENPALYSELHRRAAGIAREEGEWDTAFGHHLAAGDHTSAAELVEQLGDTLIHSGRWHTLSRWLDSLPQTTIDLRPRVALYRGRTYLWSGKLDQAIAYMERSAERYMAAGDIAGAGTALTFKCVGLRFKGRTAEAMEAANQALALQKDPNSRVAADAYRELGICLATQGRLAEASVQLQRALQVYEGLGDEPGAATICQSLGILSVRMGDLTRGAALYRRALATWQRLGSAAYAADVLNCMALIHYYTGEYDRAASILADALAKARQAGYLRVEALVLGSLGDVHRDSGNLQGAFECYEAALEIAQRVEEGPLANYLLDALSNAHRQMGDYATAERLLRQALQQAEDNQSPYEIATYSISAAALAEDQGDLDRARELLETAISGLATSGAKRELARARFRLARVLFSLGERAAAGEQLRLVLDLSRQLGYDSFMVVEGRGAETLLAWAVDQGIGGRRLELVASRLRQPRPTVQVARRPRIRVEPSGPEKIEIRALGVAQVFLDSRLVTTSDWAVEKTKELFFYLLHQDRPVRKEQVVDDVWPEVDVSRSNGQFHSTMYRLRRAIFPQCVTYRDGRYQLTLGRGYWYDVDEFRRLTDEAEQAGLPTEKRIECYRRALEIYKGPFLDELYSDWVVPIREKLELSYLQALTALARLRAQKGALQEAVELLRIALAKDPFREEIHYGLIHYSALLGDRAAALRYYRRYVELLRDELRADPSPGIHALAESIAKGQAVPSA